MKKKWAKTLYFYENDWLTQQILVKKILTECTSEWKLKLEPINSNIKPLSF